MKKIYVFILCIFAVLGMSSCNENTNSPIEKECVVLFDSVGGSAVQQQTILEGSVVIKPEDPKKEGYTFDGWYLNDELYIFTTRVEQNFTLTAHWTKLDIKYTIEFDASGGSETPKQIVNQGEKLTKPQNPVKEGYTFNGWYLNDTPYNFSASVTSNFKLVAKWSKNIEIGELSEYYTPMTNHFDESFKTELHNLLKSTHKTQLSYTPDVWDALKQLDEDPSNSDNIICIYTGRSIPKANQDKGTSGNNLWNREHAWPNSHGFGSKDYAAYTDIHHLFASEKNINNTRGNKDFNYVTNGNQDEYGNKWNNTAFEPRDEVKGDLARAMFYLVARYQDASELVLSLVDSSTSSSSNKTGQLGYLSVLLEWHELDPVSEKEIKRNELAYQIQGNRNPFIDYPDWVYLLYPNA